MRPAGRRPPRLHLQPPKRHQRNERERHLYQEDRLPAHGLGQDPASGGAECRPEDAGRDPHADSLTAGSGRRGQETERRRDEQRCADGLSRPCAHEHGEGRRQPASEGGCRKDQRPRREDRAWRSPGNEGGRQRSEREREIEGRQHPGHRGDVDVELAEHVGKREGDDRRIGEREPDRETDQARPHETSLGTPVGSSRRSVQRLRAKYRSVAHAREGYALDRTRPLGGCRCASFRY